MHEPSAILYIYVCVRVDLGKRGEGGVASGELLLSY